MRQAAAAATAALTLLAGCGTTAAVVEAVPVGRPYAGPMNLKPAFSDQASVVERSGTSGRALECDAAPYNGGGADYVDSGLESVQQSPSEAVENWLDNEAWAYQLPKTGYRIERKDGDRVLLSYDAGGQTKVAFIAADGIRDYNDDEGWGVESWAECDPAELPATMTEELGIGVWEDEAGGRVPVTRILSIQGAAHCDWQHITFLMLGPRGRKSEFVRDTTGEFTDLLQTTYDASAALPGRATDTGLRRNGRQLWLSGTRDAAYLVNLNDPDDVERWPAAKQPIGCA